MARVLGIEKRQSGLLPGTVFQVARKAIKVDAIEYNNSPFSILIAHFFIVLFIGNTANAADALQQLIFLGGALDAESPERRLIVVHRITGMSISLTLLLGYPLYLLLHEALGPRMQCILGILCNFIGYFFLMQSDTIAFMQIGVSFFAISSCCILCSSLSIACQFPRNVNLILCLLGAAFETSPIVTHLFRIVIVKLGARNARTFVPLITAIQCAVCIQLAIQYVPSKPFRTPTVVSGIIYKDTIERATNHGVVSAVSSFLGQQFASQETFAVGTKWPTNVKEREIRSKSVNDEQHIQPADSITRKEVLEANNMDILDEIEENIIEEGKKTQFTHHIKFPIQLTAGNAQQGVLRRYERLWSLPPQLRYDDYITLEELGIYPNSIHYIPKGILAQKWRLPPSKRYLTASFWIFFPFFLLSFIRRKHIMVSLRANIQEIGPSDSYDFHWNSFVVVNLIALCGFFNFVWGYFTKRYGSAVTLLISHLLGTLSTVCFSSTIGGIRVLGLLPMLVHISSVPGLAGIFCHDTYGFQSGHHVVGALTTLVGMFSLIHDFFWAELTITYWPSFRDSAAALAGLSGVLFASPMALYVLEQQSRQEMGLEEVKQKATTAYALRARLEQHKTQLPYNLRRLSNERSASQDHLEQQAGNALPFVTAQENLLSKPSLPIIAANKQGLGTKPASTEPLLEMEKGGKLVQSENLSNRETILREPRVSSVTLAAHPLRDDEVEGNESNFNLKKDCYKVSASETLFTSTSCCKQENDAEKKNSAKHDGTPAILPQMIRLQQTQSDEITHSQLQQDIPRNSLSSEFSTRWDTGEPIWILAPKGPRVQQGTKSKTISQHNGDEDLSDVFATALGPVTSGEAISERMLRTACQIKSFEPLFPLLPIYESSSSMALAEDCIAQRVIEEWERVPSIVPLQYKHNILEKASHMSRI